MGHVRKIHERRAEGRALRRYFVDMGGKFVHGAWALALALAWGAVGVGDGWSQTPAASTRSLACDSAWVLSGSVLDDMGLWIPSSMVVNRRTGAGEFVGSDGEFLVRVCPGDTLVFGAVGYRSEEHVAQTAGRWDVTLSVLRVEVGTAEVLAPRSLNDIVRDIRALGYKEEDFRVSGVNAFQSPITFLYEEFSREAQSRREVARLENDDRRRALLQELFVKYVDYDIVDLQPEEFEAFALFCDPGDAMLQQWSQYEFIQYVKQRFQVFRMLPRSLSGSDMDYHLDGE